MPLSLVSSPRDSTRHGRPGSSGAKTATPTWIGRAERIGHHTRHLAEQISSRRQHPVTADSPEGTSFSRMSPEVSCSGEIEVFPARLIVGRAARARTGASPLVLLRFWRSAVRCDTCPSAHAYGRGCRVRAAGNSLPLSQWAGTGRLVPENRTQVTPAPLASPSVRAGPGGTS